MRAVKYSRTGSARDVLEIVDKDRPTPGPGEVRVRIAWSGVNPSDTKSRAGARSPFMPFPEVTPHSDGAGIVDAIGDGVATHKNGDRVWVWNAAWGRPDGTSAEWVVVPAGQAVALPANVPLEVGACLGIPALTACHAVLMNGGVAGKRVLVAGGAGAVGYYAIQMARLCGASQIIATVSSDQKAALAKSAGADASVNYRSEKLVERVHELTSGAGVDRIIEVDLAANAMADFQMLAANSELVVYGSGQPEVPVPFVPGILKNIRLSFFIVYHLLPDDRAVATERLTRWLEDGALNHQIAARLELDAIAEAHELVESGKVIGNVVVSPWQGADRPG
ncbi:MAG TPA: NADPH:quinone reductase [Dokdonella sp.]|mgnify:CR=1 FL=1|jgi:NADPH:quinone reductase|nr:NADPH:quinone reductase [Dokdonella sp.]